MLERSAPACLPFLPSTGTVLPGAAPPQEPPSGRNASSSAANMLRTRTQAAPLTRMGARQPQLLAGGLLLVRAGRSASWRCHLRT